MEQNRPRYDESSGGHVESYFVRLNHPKRPLALWLKATILARTQAAPVAELWCIYFDGERSQNRATKSTVPLSDASFGEERIELGDASFLLDRAGSLRGSLDDCSWDLTFAAADGAIGSPLCLLPSKRLLETPVPRSKLLTPLPLLRFNGKMRVAACEVPVEDWIGMQGHNWGSEHAWEYAWGQCHFLDADDEAHCSVEAFSGKLRLLGVTTPYISDMVVRRGEREYRFDHLIDLWRQRPALGDLCWSLTMRGDDGQAQLEMKATPERAVCLGYENPDGRDSFCFNSKLADVTLRLNPRDEAGFVCHSTHGGALELLRSEQDSRFEVV